MTDLEMEMKEVGRSTWNNTRTKRISDIHSRDTLSSNLT